MVRMEANAQGSLPSTCSMRETAGFFVTIRYKLTE
jgi:hypothetical protein